MLDCKIKASIGRTAKIGDIYDVRREQFLTGLNIFNGNVPADIINFIENRSCFSEFVSSNKISDKISALKLDGELAISILSGLVKCGSGAVSYVNKNINTKEQVQCSFVQNIRTMDEKININDKRLKGLIATNALDQGTHVVVGISWGANAAVTMTYDNSNAELKNEINGKLKIIFEKLKLKVEGNAEGSYEEKEKEFFNKISLNVYADMPPTGLESPTNIKDVKEYISSISRKFANANEKGRQLGFYLLPLSTIKKVFELQTSIDHITKDIEASTLKKLEQFFDTVSESEAILKNLFKFVENNIEFISSNDKSEIRSYINEFESSVSEMRSDIAELLPKVRAGDEEFYEIIYIMRDFEKNSKASSLKVNEFVDSYKYLKEKINFINQFRKNNINVVSEVTQFAELKLKYDNNQKRLYMLLCSFNNDRLLPEWTENITYFQKLLRNSEDKGLCFIDKDVLLNIAKNESLPEGIRVVEYFNGTYISDDCLSEQKKYDSQCVAVCDNIKPYNSCNLRSVAIDFPCPLSIGYGKCSKENRNWFCVNCREQIEYNFDGKFYCGCGFNLVKKFCFKCTDINHGIDLVPYPENEIKKLIKDLQPLPEFTILVLGETGVGKSTWINALANYISHETIDEVLKTTLINLIPTEFELPQKINGVISQQTIRVGVSENESFVKGQSATQKCKAYLFRHNNCIYRVIDTPGIGDSRGIEQDKTNMENIMQFIAQYKEIHGICILMKPNESKLTPSFEFCFKELLVQFHRSAVENIVFCFTQTAGYNFNVAQTLTPLTTLLDKIENNLKIKIPRTEDRLYPFDNMAYRYLCAVKHKNVKFSSDEESIYNRAYNISRNVTNRMLLYFSNRKAHNVKESISIYSARNVIIKLTHPMALINTAVDETLAEVKEKQKLIEKYKNDEEKLKKELIKKIPFKRWRVKYYDKYSCYKCATEKQYHGDDRLQFVNSYPAAMNKDPFVLYTIKHHVKTGTDKCPDCGSSSDIRLGKNWFYKEEGIDEEEDVTIAARIKEKLTTKEGIQKEITNIQLFKNELIEEKNTIVKASAKFAYFLKIHSITTYNDATEKYLKLLIEREQKFSKDNVKKERYVQLLEQYKEEKIILQRDLEQSSNYDSQSLSINDILKTIEHLKNLKHYGKDIEDAIGECTKITSAALPNSETEVFLPNTKKSQSWIKNATNWIRKFYS